MKKILLLPLFMMTMVLISCGQKEVLTTEEASTIKEEQTKASKKDPKHPYGGWYCPDNIRGFPAVDIQDLDKVPVVQDRLPTKEETRNGISLMFFDTERTPDARPLDIKLPKLARYYSDITRKNELVVLIQAVIVRNDTVAGFRYLNGGNGSSWFSDLELVGEEEVDQLSQTRFVTFNSKINASPDKIWDVMTNPGNTDALGKVFAENNFIKPDRKDDPLNQFNYLPQNLGDKGLLTAFWKDLYVQVDYNLDGSHCVEKVLLLPGEDKTDTNIHIVIGPFEDNYVLQKIVWENWFKQVVELSEEQ